MMSVPVPGDGRCRRLVLLQSRRRGVFASVPICAESSVRYIRRYIKAPKTAFAATQSHFPSRRCRRRCLAPDVAHRRPFARSVCIDNREDHPSDRSSSSSAFSSVNGLGASHHIQELLSVVQQGSRAAGHEILAGICSTRRTSPSGPTPRSQRSIASILRDHFLVFWSSGV